MIVVSLENSKQKVLIDTDVDSDSPLNEDTLLLLKDWGIKDASYANSETLEGVYYIIQKHLDGFTTLKEQGNKAKKGEIEGFISGLYPKLAEWELEDREGVITYHACVTDAVGIKRYICLIFQDIPIFNR